MAAAWRPDFRWNVYAPRLIVGIGVAAAVIGLIDHMLSWVVVGVVAAVIGLLLPRLHGQARIGSPHLLMLEGDITAIGEPPERKEERATLVELYAPPPPEEPPPPRG